jgi:hypothetical protein
MSRRFLTPLTLVVALSFALRASAQNEITIKVAPDTVVPFLMPITLPGITCMAVSDVADALVIGHKTDKGGFLTVYRLDGKGSPGPHVTVTLPRPPALDGLPNYPICLAFHPKLPVLYVWQDAALLKPPPEPVKHPGFATFDHLLVYSVAGVEPRLLASLARGDEFSQSVRAGSVALDAAAKRLYVPNLLILDQPDTPAAVGCYRLGDDGVPMPPDPTTAKPGEPIKLFKRMRHGAYDLTGTPVGQGFIPVSDDVVIVGGLYGPTTWDMSSSRAAFGGVTLYPYVGAGYYSRIIGHPTLPVVYSFAIGLQFLGCIEHSEGFLTLMPQWSAADGIVCRSSPVILARHNQIAVGGEGHVYLFDLDAKGKFKGTRVQAIVASPNVEALAYSEKFDRLFVPIEPPEKKP